MNGLLSADDGADQLLSRIQDKKAHIGVIGLGYVGLPLAQTFADKGIRVTGFDLGRPEPHSPYHPREHRRPGRR